MIGNGTYTPRYNNLASLRTLFLTQPAGMALTPGLTPGLAPSLYPSSAYAAVSPRQALTPFASYVPWLGVGVAALATLYFLSQLPLILMTAAAFSLLALMALRPTISSYRSRYRLDELVPAP